jgi:hypothetical protein
MQTDNVFIIKVELPTYNKKLPEMLFLTDKIEELKEKCKEESDR